MQPDTIDCQVHGCPNEGHIACTESGTVFVCCHEHMPEFLVFMEDLENEP